MNDGIFLLPYYADIRNAHGNEIEISVNSRWEVDVKIRFVKRAMERIGWRFDSAFWDGKTILKFKR